MADRVILLNSGRIEQNGTPVDLYEQPANTFVARFIGTPPMNLLRSSAARERRGDRRHRRARRCCRATCAGGMLGVRPEHIALASRSRHAAIGRERRVPGRRFAGDLPARRQRARRAGRRAASASTRGDRDPARRGPAGAQHFFDASDGARHACAAGERRDVAGVERTILSTEEDTMLTSVRRKAHRRRSRPRSCSSLALAQAPVEVSFFYPVAVGGPITKIIDGYAADFEKENPGIKLKPIYSGSYQESIAKALTAVKSGEPPVMSILLSTDMYTLIDEDAIVPFDDLIKTPEDQAWLKCFYPALHGEQPDRRQDLGHSVPALDDRAVLEQGDVQGGGPRSEPAAAELDRAARVRAEAHQARRVGQRHAVGRADPVVGLPVLAVPGARDPERRQPDEPGGHADATTTGPRSSRRCSYWVDLATQAQGASGRHRRVGHDAARLLREARWR